MTVFFKYKSLAEERNQKDKGKEKKIYLSLLDILSLGELSNK